MLLFFFSLSHIIYHYILLSVRGISDSTYWQGAQILHEISSSEEYFQAIQLSTTQI